MKNVYLIEDQGNSPGRIYAAFLDEEEAEKYIGKSKNGNECGILIVTLFASAREGLGGIADAT